METVKINMVPKGAVKAAHASQGDAPRVVRFELFDEFLPYTLDGSEDITLKVVRPDTEEIVSSVNNTEEAYIDVSFTSEMTAIRGVANCEIKISKSGAEIGSHNFDLNIERDAYGEDITVETASGVIATFTTGVIDNLVGLKTTFEPKQDLHGYETPWIDSNVVNKAPYLSRSLSGTASRIGNYEFNKLVGGTYAFNQRFNINDVTASTLNGITYTPSDNKVIISGTSTARSNKEIGRSSTGVNHKILVCGIPAGATQQTYYAVINEFENNTYKKTNYITRDNIINISTSSANAMRFEIVGAQNADLTVDNIIFTPQIFDLTQMFGSTIADYIYSLETAQAGAGVSFFKSLFGADYYAYNAGELMSVKTSAHVTKDANNNVISNIALDPDLELRGIPKLDANNNLYYDGDTYESNGDVTRRYGIVDLGSLSWETMGDAEKGFYTAPFDAVRSQALTAKYTYVDGSTIYDGSAPDKTIGLTPYNDIVRIRIKDKAYDNVIDFKNSLSGVYLVYEKATPTAESADPFTDPQEIDASGSEEFIDARAVSIPVGHESYYANICEIEGIDEINLFHTGVNLVNPDALVTGWLLSDGSIDPSTTNYKTTDFIKVNPSDTYFITETGTSRCKFYDENKQPLTNVFDGNINGNRSETFTVSSDARYMRKSVSNTKIDGFTINYPATETEYQAYDGESALVEIGQEVYGGYYDKDLGIVLTKKKVYLDSLTWSVNAPSDTYWYLSSSLENSIDVLNSDTNVRIISEILSGVSAYDRLTVNSISIISSSRAFITVLKSAFNTVEAFVSWLTSVNAYAVYELETPIIIPADKVNLTTVKGVNNVWSDTNGETEVKFYVKEA